MPESPPADQPKPPTTMPVRPKPPPSSDFRAPTIDAPPTPAEPQPRRGELSQQFLRRLKLDVRTTSCRSRNAGLVAFKLGRCLARSDSLILFSMRFLAQEKILQHKHVHVRREEQRKASRGEPTIGSPRTLKLVFTMTGQTGQPLECLHQAVKTARCAARPPSGGGRCNPHA